jgi:hypothetical protein
VILEPPTRCAALLHARPVALGQVVDHVLVPHTADHEQDTRLGFLKTDAWFCYAAQCPMVVGRIIVYRGTGHVTCVTRLSLPHRFGPPSGAAFSTSTLADE